MSTQDANQKRYEKEYLKKGKLQKRLEAGKVTDLKKDESGNIKEIIREFTCKENSNKYYVEITCIEQGIDDCGQHGFYYHASGALEIGCTIPGEEENIYIWSFERDEDNNFMLYQVKDIAMLIMADVLIEWNIKLDMEELEKVLNFVLKPFVERAEIFRLTPSKSGSKYIRKKAYQK